MKQALLLIGLLVLIAAAYWVITSDDTADVELDNQAAIEADEQTGAADAIGDAPEAIDDEAETDATHHVFDIDSFMYGYSMDEIRVQQGDTVTINLTTSEGLHDWVVDEFNAATAIISGDEEASVTFVADTPGTFEYYCSVGNHRAQGMVGTLIVE